MITKVCEYMHDLLNDSGWSLNENERLEEVARQTNNAWNDVSKELKKDAETCKMQWCLLQAAKGCPEPQAPQKTLGKRVFDDVEEFDPLKFLDL